MAQSRLRTPEPPIMTLRTALAWLALLTVLFVLALRLTIVETLITPLNDRLLALVQAQDDTPLPAVPGAGTTVGLALIVVAAAGMAVCVTRVTRTAWVRLAMIAAILAWAVTSALAAGNKYRALVGTFDLGAAMLGGWAVAALARTPVRRIVVFSVLLAVLGAWSAKAWNQRLDEIPSTIADYAEKKEEFWKRRGVPPGSNEIALFEGRMYSREITGFLTMSNVTAIGFTGLSLITVGFLLANALAKPVSASDPPATPQKRSTDHPPSRQTRTPAVKNEVPLPVLVTACTILLLLLGLPIPFISGSKGASAAFVLCVTPILAGAWFPQFFVTHRRRLIVGTAMGLVLLAAAVLSYGLLRHGLPSRSLLFRWHYWTAATQISRAHPVLGVGLNNFGDYYSNAKVPYSPEDPKDPHNYFVRFATELGLPATGLLAAFVFWHLLRPVSARAVAPQPALSEPPRLPALLTLGAFFCLAWFLTRLFIADVPELVYQILLNSLYALCALGAFSLLPTAATYLPARLPRLIPLAALAAAAAMFIYDQVNMALVTGPVAMLFWVILAVADTTDPDCSDTPPPPHRLALAPGAIMIAGAIALALLVWRPITARTFVVDPDPHEERAAISHRNRLFTRALTEADQAVALSPDAISPLSTRIRIKLDRAADHLAWPLYQLAAHDGYILAWLGFDMSPVSPTRMLLYHATRPPAEAADDIRRVLAMAQGNPYVQASYALGDSDLPMSDRRAAAQRALWLDEQSESHHEAPRLTPTHHACLAALLRR